MSEAEKERFYNQLAEAFPNNAGLVSMYSLLGEHRKDDEWGAKETLELIIDCGYHLRCLATGMGIVALNAAKVTKLLSADLEGTGAQNESVE